MRRVRLSVLMLSAVVAGGLGAAVIAQEPQHFSPKGKMPSKYTIEAQQQQRKILPFANTKDFEEANPNVSQGGGERAKSSSIRRRSELNLRKSSYGPSPAGLLAVLAPSVSIFCQGKTHHSPNSACCPNSSRYSLPFSQQRRAVTCNCRYTWRNSSR